MKHFISIIIVTFNRPEETLHTLFKSIKKQLCTHYEIILVDESTDPNIKQKNALIAREYGAFYHEFNQKPSSTNAGRNFGFSKTKGDVILYLDDDVEFVEEDYLNKLLEAFEQFPDAIGIGTNIIPPYEKRSWKQHWDTIRKFILHVVFGFSISNSQVITFYFRNLSFYKTPSKITAVDWVYGGCMAWKRSLNEKVKLDDRMIKYCLRDDVDFSYRAKKYGGLYLTPFATVIHHVNKSGRMDFKRMALMEFTYWAYLYWKNMMNPSSLVLYVYSLTILFRYLRKAVFSISFTNIRDTISSYITFLGLIPQIKNLDLRKTNSLLL